MGDALQAEEDAFGVHAVDAVPVSLGDVHDVGATRDAGVVEQDVDLTERFKRLAHHAVDVFADRRRPPARPAPGAATT